MSNQASSASLLGLPAELRLEIYSHVLTDFDPKRTNPLLTTSKLINQESMRAYFDRVEALGPEFDKRMNEAKDYYEWVWIIPKEGLEGDIEMRESKREYDDKEAELHEYTMWRDRVIGAMAKNGYPVGAWLQAKE